MKERILSRFMGQPDHIWSFSTVGGVKRVNIDSAGDLINLPSLDPKLWTALSCPVNDLEIDQRTLELVDTDKDGHIRVPEVIAAVKWMTSMLKDPGDLLKQEAIFPLSAINDNTEEGKELLNSAREILKNLGIESEHTLTVADTSDTEKIFAGTAFNGDGVITEDTVKESDELDQLLNEIIKYSGSVIDRGGKQGINKVLADAFFDNAEKYAAWYAKRDADRNSILPFGENTEAAYDNFCSVKSKIDDFFIRCRLAAFDAQSTEVLNLQVARVESITDKDLSDCLYEIAAYPLAKIEANRSLPLSSGINPAWENGITEFKKLTVDNLFPGTDSLSEQGWQKISDTYVPYAKWIAEKDGTALEPLGAERIQAILSGEDKDKLAALIAQDEAVACEADNILLVDKMVRYYRDLFTLLKNFVTFYDFYTPGSKSIFQAGTLFIDQRSCDLCIKVQDMPKHNTLASYSGMYLVYCDCVSRTADAKMSIVAALTAGDVDNLLVGRNALFYDRKGLDWDATIVKIVDNPISIRQAFFSPYRKVSRFVENQANKIASSENDKVSANMSKGVESIPLKADDSNAKKDTPKQPFDIGKFVGIFAAISLALGAIGAAIATGIGGFMKLSWWKMPLAVAGLLLLISGPSMVIAYLKLRKRNLAPLLDANGWAINARVIININFGNTLTHLAELPRGARINFNDPFTQKKRPILPTLLAIIILAAIVLYCLWKFGVIHIHPHF